MFQVLVSQYFIVCVHFLMYLLAYTKISRNKNWMIPKYTLSTVKLYMFFFLLSCWSKIYVSQFHFNNLDQLSKLIIGKIGNEQKNEVHGNDKPDKNRFLEKQSENARRSHQTIFVRLHKFA